MPPQQLSFNKKNKVWRKRCIDTGDSFSLQHHHVARKSVTAMKINYDLLNGKIHMEDLKMLLNPYHIDASFIPDEIQHYSTINSVLEVLHGEESRRLFDFRVVVTNPNSISEIEEEKNRIVNERLQQLIADTSQSEEEFNEELEKLADYFQFEYQDKREVRANQLLNHYIKELEIPMLFHKGFEDAYTAGEEAYICDIVGGEPTIEKVNPMKMRVIGNGYDHEIEKADMIVLEDYWAPGRVIDTYWDQLSKEDVKKIEHAITDGGNSTWADSMDNIDERFGYVPKLDLEWTAGDAVDPRTLFDARVETSLLPYDLNGNVRVLRVFWKSRRKIKKVKSYDPETGEEQFDFYPETYHCRPELGEEEQSFWVNEAWEGTKIADNIYVNMRPRPIQYNRLSNPSRCHFGIIGSVYTRNGSVPFSMVDIMKPYAYLYDVIQDRLNKTLAKNVGKVIRLDFAKIPKGWDVDKWMYFINVNGVAVENSWNEGDRGAASGRLAASLNNASSGVVDASLGQEISQYIQLLEWINTKMMGLVGMTPQRMGQVSNRETVGGVERATLQSSHSTEWLFMTHDSVKKRVLECFLETAKIAFRGRKKKFEYILSDGSREITELDGDEFAECDYGLVVDNSNGSQELNQKLDMLAQAALQNQLLDFSTIMQIYTSMSLAEKQKLVQTNEKRVKAQREKELQQQQQLQQQQLQQQAALAQQKNELDLQMFREKLENNIIVAQINAEAEHLRMQILNHDNAEANDIEREKIAEQARQFDAQLEETSSQFDKKLALDSKKQSDDARLKEKEIAKKTTGR